MKTVYILGQYLALLFFSISCSIGASSMRSESEEKITYNLREGVSAFGKGEYSRANNFFKEALEQSVQIDNLDKTTAALLGLAEVDLVLGLPSSAYAHITHAATITNHEHFEEYRGKVEIAYARYYEYLQQEDKALDSYTRVVATSADKEDKGIAYNNIGRIYLKKKQYEKAEKFFLRALDIHKDLSQYEKLADNNYNLGRLFYLQKNYQKAETYFVHALRFDKHTESTRDILKDLKMIGLVYQKQGERNKAFYYFYRALQLAKIVNKSQVAYFSGKVVELKPASDQ